MQSIARSLGYPDTVFLGVARGGSAWIADAYSPAEMLEFCVQGLLGAAAVLRHSGRASGPVEFVTNRGRYRVYRDANDMEWLHLPKSMFLRDMIKVNERELSSYGEGKAILIEAGRRRIFLNAGTERALCQIRIGPERVTDILRSYDINGLCFYAPNESGAAMRVFTSSLSGREDNATGGAAASLALLLSPNSDRILQIEQGSGAPTGRGLLFAKRSENDLFVGGYVSGVALCSRLAALGQLL